MESSVSEFSNLLYYSKSLSASWIRNKRGQAKDEKTDLIKVKSLYYSYLKCVSV